MMRYVKLILFTLTSAILPAGCVIDTFDTKLIIVNKSSETVFVELSKLESFKSHPISIDTVTGDTLWNYMRWIPPMDSLNNMPPSGSWERFINHDCVDSTLTVFIFNKELLKSTSPDSLIKMQIYAKKFTYKVKDLEKLNWRIEYK